MFEGKPSIGNIVRHELKMFSWHNMEIRLTKANIKVYFDV